MRHVLIIAGGSGTRLWPLSRQGEPKQLLELIDGVSLLRMSYERVQGLVPDENILVCTGAAYADTVAALLPEIPAENILGEPVGRDSLNAVAWPAGVIAAKDPQAVVATVTADHVIRPVRDFRAALDRGFALAETDPTALVTFGVIPTEPNTGFGYLHRGAPVPEGHGACEVAEFVEKPGPALARQYFESGDYWWNSGMFVWRASTLLDVLSALRPATRAKVDELVADPASLARVYPQLEKISVDFAVMEPVSQGRTSCHVVAVPLDIQWYDVGSFESLAPHLPDDGHGNHVTGLTASLDADGNLLINRREDAVLAVAGLHGMAVVTTDRATLVVPLSDSQKVKQLVALVAEQLGGRYA
ncbi:mannose-1-phosphate guanylyltransferase [Acidipropionibacterium timonense]|uniref:mannose-1-phosphate guanylyltransferase n=1 Tax=Acidipropionibacterium timonense TaxID=2161818 RepID=UPI0010315EE4|nr:mannose-1-phosphate guanylyltransferase [Acidipropionibacterium timonense]